MRHTSQLILLLLAVLPARVLADSNHRDDVEAGVHETLTEEVFLKAIDADHPALVAAALELGRAEARKVEASLLDDPRIEFSREDPDDIARETTWAIAWVPPLDGRRRGSMRVAEADVERETHRLAARRLEFRFQAREVYARWALGQARAVLLDGHRARLEGLAQRMRNRSEAGEESRLSSRRIEIAFGRARAKLVEARAREGAARARAAAWLASDVRELSIGSAHLPDLPDPPARLEEGLTEAVAKRPDVLAVRSEIERSRSLRQLARRVFEAPEVLLGWKTVENDLPGASGELSGPVFALGWRVPAFDRRQAERREAQAALDAATANEQWVTARAQGELAAALVAYRELRTAALAAQDELPELEGVARAAEASFEAGESTVTDLLDTLRALLDARILAIDLYGTALAAHRQLEIESGGALDSGDPS